jgi:hypothetical protein
MLHFDLEKEYLVEQIVRFENIYSIMCHDHAWNN